METVRWPHVPDIPLGVGAVLNALRMDGEHGESLQRLGEADWREAQLRTTFATWLLGRFTSPSGVSDQTPPSWSTETTAHAPEKRTASGEKRAVERNVLGQRNSATSAPTVMTPYHDHKPRFNDRLAFTRDTSRNSEGLIAAISAPMTSSPWFLAMRSPTTFWGTGSEGLEAASPPAFSAEPSGRPASRSVWTATCEIMSCRP